MNTSQFSDQACAREPIHIPGSIQPHGVLLVLDDAMAIVQASVNLGPVFGVDHDRALGRPVGEIVPAAVADALRSPSFEIGDSQAVTILRSFEIGKERYDVLAHRSGERIVLEFEKTGDAGTLDAIYPNLRSFIEKLNQLETLEAISQSAAREVFALTGFDRVMIYRFDENWNGTVIAEARNETLPSYLDLRFPASDIPAQARELYRINRLRLIPDADYTPIPIEPALDPASDAPVDLSFSVLRSVSPVHLHYMRNMGTPASMSISIVDDGRLWGLISCHNGSPRQVPSHIRTACDFIGQVTGMQIGARMRSDATSERVRKHRIESRLLTRMAAESSFVDGLIGGGEDLLALADASGAAVLWDERIHTIGETPGGEVIEALANWLSETKSHDETFQTSQLEAIMPDWHAHSDKAAGVMAISISQLYPSFIIWFRPEVVRTVRWGGDPRKSQDPAGQLNPRKSFEMWKQTVRHQAEPWGGAQIEAAESLRNAIVGIVMRKAEEMAAISDELQRSNTELEAFSYSVSHDLRAPFRHIVGYAELLKEATDIAGDARALRYADTIIESAHSAGQLVDDLLEFSQMGRSQLNQVHFEMNTLVDEVMRLLQPEIENRDITWTIGSLGAVVADPSFMRSVWQNLISNAVKYTRGTDPSTIEIGCRRGEAEMVYFIKDDGVGFDMAYVDKLFGVFQRLHRIEDYEGSGIGLANVRRIIERHGGRVWADGVLGAGAVFSFTLPDIDG